MHTQRLNPFAFPAETNVRFMLFILAALSVSVYVAFVGIYSPIYPSDEPVVMGTPDSNVYLLSQVGESLRFLVFQAGVVGLVLLPAAVIYYLHPTYLRRREKLTPLLPSKDAIFETEVQRLAELAGVTPLPTVEMSNESRSLQAQAFGVPSQYVLRLDGGLRLLLRKSPATFQAIVLHELSHIVNGDVARSYFSLALWLVVLLVAGGSLLVFSLASDSYDMNDVGLWLQIGAMLAIVTVIWAGLLRVREFYADWRAAALGAEQPLVAIIKSGLSAKKETTWSNLWRFHPTAQERLARLQQPARLFRVAFDLPFLAGCMLAFALTGALFMFLSLVTGIWSGITLGQSALMSVSGNIQGGTAVLVILSGVLLVILSILPLIFIGGYLIAGTVGLQAQREAVAEMHTGQQGITGFLRLGLFSALVALGLELGFLITPVPILSPLGVYWGDAVSDPLRMIPWVLLWLNGVTVVTWLGLLYARFFGKRLLGLHIGHSPPKWKYRFLTLTLSGWLGLTYLPLLVGRLAILYSQHPNYPAEIQILISVAIVGLMAMLALYVIIFGLTWLIGQFISASRCPVCGQKVQPNIAGAEMCEHCGKPLTPWLLV